METFVVRNLGLISGLHQRLPAFDNEFGGPAAKNCLLAKEIGFSLLGKGCFKDAAARRPNTVSIGQCISVSTSGCILEHGDQRRHAVTLLVLATNQAAG